MDFEELIKETKRINKKFGRAYNKLERVTDILEELGELAQAVLIVEGSKRTTNPKKQKTVDDIADALGDILFGLILMAELYGIDLRKEYKKMLGRLEKRIDSGEFKKKVK